MGIVKRAAIILVLYLAIRYPIILIQVEFTWLRDIKSRN